MYTILAPDTAVPRIGKVEFIPLRDFTRTRQQKRTRRPDMKFSHRFVPLDVGADL